MLKERFFNKETKKTHIKSINKTLNYDITKLQKTPLNSYRSKKNLSKSKKAIFYK